MSRSVEAGQGRPAATVRGASPERHGPAREAARGSARRAGSAGSGRLSPAFLSSPHFPAGSAPSLRSRRVSARPGWGQDGSLALAELGGNLETSGTRSALGSGKPAGRRALPHGTPLVSPGLSQESGRLPLSSISTPQGNVRFPLSVPFPKLGCPREAPGVGGGCCGLWSLFWKNLFSWGDLDVRTTCFVPKAKDVLSQAGPAERWSGIDPTQPSDQPRCCSGIFPQTHLLPPLHTLLSVATAVPASVSSVGLSSGTCAFPLYYNCL